MIVLWITLLLLHQGYTLVPVTTVQLGEPVTLTCVLSAEQQTSSELHWYKQTAGDTLKLIVKLLKNASPSFEPGYSPSRLSAKYEENALSLTILQTVEEDEGMYHCSFTDWIKNHWHGTYLSIKGNAEKASNFTVIQQKVSKLNNPGGPETLQCFVLSDPDNKTCSGDLRVFWFRDKSNKSYPEIIYTDGNRRDECEKKSDSQNRCVFSMNISSSESGTFYCAVATCGQIILGNGTKLAAKQTGKQDFTALVVALTCLALSVIVNICFCYRIPSAACKDSKGVERTNSQPGHDLRQPNDNGDEGQDLTYTALHLSGGKSAREKKSEFQPKDSVYSQVKL